MNTSNYRSGKLGTLNEEGDDDDGVAVVVVVVDDDEELLLNRNKLNPLRTKWPMEPVLISVFCSVKWMRVFDSPWMGH